MLRWLRLLLALVIVRGTWQLCERKPLGATGDPSIVDQNFQVLIEGNPKNYIPGQRYNISLSCDAALKFISFTLVAESEDASVSPGPDTIGYFELTDIAETRFSMQCENMIESTNPNPKVRVSVGWTAPKAGCVLIKAAVLQHRSVWYIDGGFLTKRICPEEIDEVNSPTPPLELCCACDEAKYELIVERKWGRNTHPRDFPSESWRTRLSEIIGASHRRNYSFWAYGEFASPGLQEMAEHGATSLLEEEIKFGEVRTIIKAPGIRYRENVLSTTLANVRVDPEHHVISLVTKIEPSPDWILGVAGLELCLENCTWINEKVLNLYPWDIGTDAGPSYMSPDQPQKPPDVVRRITSTSPNDQRSPFYEESGKPMTAMATLYVRRKKLYERECDTDENLPLECATHPWNAWSECTTRCGPGTQTRTRAYKDPDLARNFHCQVVLHQKQRCVGEKCGVPSLEEDEEGEECQLRPWSAWSACSRRCGRGYITRSREYMNPYQREKCLNENPVELEQQRDCEGQDCGGRQAVDSGEETDTENSNVPDIEGNEENNEDEDAEFSNRRTNSRTYGRQPSWSADGGIDTQAEVEEELENNDEIAGIPEQIDEENEEDSYGGNRLRGNRIRGYRRNRNRVDGANNRNDDIDDLQDSAAEEDDNFGLRQEYDERGHRGVFVESSDPNKYDVLQQFCFDKPYMRRSRCDRQILGVRNYWFYDADDRQCKIFTTDDCDDNKNKFRTLDACEGTCLMPHQLQGGAREMEENNEEEEWSGRFGEPESLVKQQKKRKRKDGRKRNRRRKEKEEPKQSVAGDIRNYAYRKRRRDTIS
ncbi:unnamed protein product [Ceratitis capitata]|uniref:Spondin-1 n=1 Tax=Ceratitis capitata TaxID=7213 RepID=A0A811VCH0_CERCA|nr:unnamed protein product [Ceratitis capitata]